MRLLFASIHCYLDPSGGGALSMRELLELMAARGADCRVLTAGILDYERETTLDEMLAGLDLPSQRFRADLRHPVVDAVVARSPDLATSHPVVARSPDLATSVEVIDLTVGGVRLTLVPTASSRAEQVFAFARRASRRP